MLEISINNGAVKITGQGTSRELFTDVILFNVAMYEKFKDLKDKNLCKIYAKVMKGLAENDFDAQSYFDEVSIDDLMNEENDDALKKVSSLTEKLKEINKTLDELRAVAESLNESK